MTPKMNTRRWRSSGHFLLAAAAGTCGGLIFFYVHMPLPWMLGSMLACGIPHSSARLSPCQSYHRLPMTATIGTG